MVFNFPPFLTAQIRNNVEKLRKHKCKDNEADSVAFYPNKIWFLGLWLGSVLSFWMCGTSGQGRDHWGCLRDTGFPSITQPSLEGIWQRRCRGLSWAWRQLWMSQKGLQVSTRPQSHVDHIFQALKLKHMVWHMSYDRTENLELENSHLQGGITESKVGLGGLP